MHHMASNTSNITLEATANASFHTVNITRVYVASFSACVLTIIFDYY